MKESYGEGIAIHADPKLCVASRKAGCEALVGVRAGRVFSPEIIIDWGADAVSESGRPYPAQRYREMGRDPTGSETPRMHGNTSHVNREIPGFSRCLIGRALGRSGKSKDARR